MKKRHEVVISGIKIALLSDDSEEYVKSLARELEGRIDEFLFSGRNVSTKEALLMCALDSLDTQKKLQAELDKMRAGKEKE